MSQHFRSFFLVFFFIFSFVLSPFTALAQGEMTAARQEESSFNVVIDKVSAGVDHSLEFNLSLQNDTPDFLDNLEYTLEFYQGDALASSGELFASTTYAASLSGTLPRLSPKQHLDHVLDISYPKGLTSGNYFFQLTVFNNTKSLWTLAYTETPVALQGDGSLLPAPIGFVRVKGTGEEYAPMDGKFISPEESILLVLPLDPEFDSNLSYKDQAANLQVAGSLRRADDMDTVLHAFSPQKFAVLNTELLASFDPPTDLGAGIAPGDYVLVVDIKKENGDSVLSEPFFVRWLVEGFFSHIVDVRSGTNIYRKGDPLDLSVKLSAVNASEVIPLTVKVLFTDKNGNTFSTQKNTTIDPSADVGAGDTAAGGGIWFGDVIVDKEIRPVSLDVQLVRSDTGEVLDTYSETMDPSKLVSVNFDPNADLPVALLIGLGLMLLVIVLVVASYALHRHNHPRAGLMLFVSAFILAVLAMYVGYFLKVSGDADVLDDRNSDVWKDGTDSNEDVTIVFNKKPQGDLGICPKDGEIVFSVNTVCFGSSSKVKTQIIVDGAIAKAYDRTANSSKCYKTGGGRSACKMGRSTSLGPVSYDVYPNAANHSKNYFINVIGTEPNCAFTVESYHRTMSCHENGKCGNESSAYSQNEVNARGACANGKYSDRSDTDQTIKWSCEGIGMGNTANCQAPKSVDGKCGNGTDVCTAGKYVNTEDTSQTSRWSCDGQNGGTTDRCSAPKADEGCPSGSKLCGTRCIPNGACCTSAECVSTNACFVGRCTSNRCTFNTPNPSAPASCSADLCGPVTVNYGLDPAIVKDQNSSCQLTWNATNVASDGSGASCPRTVTCTLNGVSVPLSGAQSVTPGTYNLTCTDGDENTTTVYPRCRINPAYSEF